MNKDLQIRHRNKKTYTAKNSLFVIFYVLLRPTIKKFIDPITSKLIVILEKLNDTITTILGYEHTEINSFITQLKKNDEMVILITLILFKVLLNTIKKLGIDKDPVAQANKISNKQIKLGKKWLSTGRAYLKVKTILLKEMKVFYKLRIGKGNKVNWEILKHHFFDTIEKNEELVNTLFLLGISPQSLFMDLHPILTKLITEDKEN